MNTNIDMNELERRRSKLTRGYDLVASYRMRELGYGTPPEYRSRWRRMAAMLEYQFLPHYFGTPPDWRLGLRQFGGRRTLPDFCVIGPIKSGSSDLAVSLMLHPNVMTPLAKEFPIGDAESWRIFYPTEDEKRRHAERHGVALAPYLAPFMHSMLLIDALHRARPDAKIVLTLRDPVERTYSHWKWDMFLSGKKRAETLPFLSTFSAYVDTALEVYPEHAMYSACGASALQTSIYWKSVGYWREKFGAENVMVADMGEYFSDRNGLLRKIQEFVGLPHAEIPSPKVKVNENPIRVPPADAASKAKLKAFFEPHNQKLWDLIGKRFAW